jgi:hypothetical protein
VNQRDDGGDEGKTCRACPQSVGERMSACDPGRAAAAQAEETSHQEQGGGPNRTKVFHLVIVGASAGF